MFKIYIISEKEETSSIFKLVHTLSKAKDRHFKVVVIVL